MEAHPPSSGAKFRAKETPLKGDGSGFQEWNSHWIYATDAYNSMKLSARRLRDNFPPVAALASCYGAGPLSTIIMLCVTMLTEPGHKAINDFLRTAGSAIDSFARSLMKGAKTPDGACRAQRAIAQKTYSTILGGGDTPRCWEYEGSRGQVSTEGEGRPDAWDHLKGFGRVGLEHGCDMFKITVLTWFAPTEPRTFEPLSLKPLRNEWWRQRIKMVWKR